MDRQFEDRITAIIEQLPRRARMALAARCASRVAEWLEAEDMKEECVAGLQEMRDIANFYAEGHTSVDITDFDAHEVSFSIVCFVCAYISSIDKLEKSVDIKLLIMQDADHLLSQSRANDWSDWTPVAQSAFPDMAPQQLELTVYIPPGETDEKIIDMVLALSEGADNYHRGRRGHGVKVDAIEITSDVEGEVAS